MDLAQILHDLAFDYTLRTVALGSALLGVVSGTLGAFAMLRQQSLLGDAISHAALPGVALIFLVTGFKDPWWLALGAALAGWLGALWIAAVVRTTRVKYDAILGIVLSVFFGVGMVLLTFIQKIPTASQAGLDKFLFGQAAGLRESDVWTMAVLGGGALLIVVALWKEFKLLSFDPQFGAALGLPMRALDLGLTSLLVVAIVIGLKTVGVVLMSAMVVAPAAAARQWTDRLGLMVVLSSGFAALSGVLGTVISSTAARTPTGPVIVLSLGLVVVVSIFLAPNRGLLWRWVAQHRNRHQLQTDAVLLDLYRLAQQHGNLHHPHAMGALQAMNANPESVPANLKSLLARDCVTVTADDLWVLTNKGIVQAEHIDRQRGRRLNHVSA